MTCAESTAPALDGWASPVLTSTTMRLLVVAALLAAPVASAQAVYRWVDRSGNVHFTDNPASVPKGVTATRMGSGPPAPRAGPAPRSDATADEAPSTKARQDRASVPESGPATVRLLGVPAGVSAEDRAFVEKAIEAAATGPEVKRWGGLRRSVSVEVVPLEQLHRCGAWVFGCALGPTRVWLRSPAEARGDGRPLPYHQTVVHELGHILEFQLAGSITHRWFAEGFANLVADFDGHASREDVAHWVIARGGPRPLSAVFAPDRSPGFVVAYGVATSAVRFLHDAQGTQRFMTFFARRKGGARFEEAFRSTFGESVESFEARWVKSLQPDFYERAGSP